jgi:hypothetical protein
MKTIRPIKPGWLFASAAVVLLVGAFAVKSAVAQGLDSETAIQSIVGSEVQTGEIPIEEAGDRLVSAIGNIPESTREVLRRFNLGEVEIVRLTDSDSPKAEAVVAGIEDNRTEIHDLRVAIEASAMFYHAVNSRRIQLSDVVALEFDGDDVLIFVMADETR